MKITFTTLTSSPKGLRRGNETILETYIASGKQQVKTLKTGMKAGQIGIKSEARTEK